MEGVALVMLGREVRGQQGVGVFAKWTYCFHLDEEHVFRWSRHCAQVELFSSVEARLQQPEQPGHLIARHLGAGPRGL
jgi:hypothetical protein